MVAQSEARRKRLESVLCVDDEEDIQKIVMASLQRIGGLQVHVCSDPRVAVSKAREIMPDLILLDYFMPGLDGAALFKLLRADAKLAHLPVVFLSASATKASIAALRELGPAGILSKPFGVRELPKQVFDIWDTHNAPDV